ncbi:MULTISPECIES: hypothetical protein [unclassified Paenibacillus]|uniref:hypothetical protein n=1 Tax=unclassified Paenibacillus TaxID=185978 RepID=UPI0009AEDD52|nr:MULTISPECIES: hypothetical protein [unclassified Paenibacillus]MBE1441212.1 hypothetical protein [Paenibacillus sp. OAS669]
MNRSAGFKRTSIYGSAAGRWAAPGSADLGTAREEHDAKAGVFIGPSVEGGDKEYVHVISGKVMNRKPSFI